MNRTSLRLASSLVGISSLALVGTVALTGALTAGCGGTSYPAPSVKLDAGADRGDATDATPPPPDGGTDVVTPPTPGTGSNLVLAGEVQLIGSGTDTCTNQVPPTGDRWCGFARPSAILGATELWVVNVTKAAAGVKITCGAGDLNCLRLSGGLYSANGTDFRVNGFDGDTLTYEETPSSSTNGFEGNIFAWRPGWTAPRQLATNTGLACNGHAVSNAIVCIGNPVVDANQTFETVELRAGFLDNQAGGELPLVDTIIIQTKDDALFSDGTPIKKWGVRLSPDGKSLAWSSRADAAGTEDLKWQNIGDDASRLAVATDVDQWSVSADSKKWFWLKTFNYDVAGAPSGTLQSAPYPAGKTPLTIATNVGDYNEAGSTGILYRSKVTMDLGDLLLAPDRDAPSTVATLDTGVAFVFEADKAGKNATYTKKISTLGTNIFLFDLYLGNSMNATPCVLASTPTTFLPPTFIAGGSLVAWGRFNSQSGEVEGLTTTLAGCATQKFASDIFGWTPIGDEGLVFLDTLAADPTVNEASLRYAKVANGALPAVGTVVQARAGLQYATLLPALPAVIYTITSNTSADGLYVNGTLPFKVTATVPPPDGGTDAGGGDTTTDTGAVPEAGNDVGSDTGANEAGASETGAEVSDTDGGAADASPSG